MNEQLISFETAKLAKDKGFQELVSNCYHNKKLFGSYAMMSEDDSAFIDIMDGNELENHNHIDFIDFEDRFSAPTQSLLQKWLREKHHLIIIVAYQYEHDSTPYSYWIYKELQSLPINQWVNDLNTYEEALELGLQEALKLI